MSIDYAGHIAHRNGIIKAKETGTYLIGYGSGGTLGSALKQASVDDRRHCVIRGKKSLKTTEESMCLYRVRQITMPDQFLRCI